MCRLNRFCIIAMLKPQYINANLYCQVYYTKSKYIELRGNHLVFDIITLVCSIHLLRPIQNKDFNVWCL